MALVSVSSLYMGPMVYLAPGLRALKLIVTPQALNICTSSHIRIIISVIPTSFSCRCFLVIGGAGCYTETVYRHYKGERLSEKRKDRKLKWRHRYTFMFRSLCSCPLCDGLQKIISRHVWLLFVCLFMFLWQS